jgi:hypothetical protein
VIFQVPRFNPPSSLTWTRVTLLGESLVVNHDTQSSTR